MSKEVELTPDELLIQGTCAVLVDGKINGTAWLVNKEGYLLTAGHVLGTKRLERDRVEVRFADDIPHVAHKIAWGFDWDLGLDFAVLQLSSPFPERQPLPVSLAESVEGKLRAFGYGKTMENRAKGVGEFLGPFDPNDNASARLFSLDSKQLGEGGFSGSAVYSDRLGAVVGLITNATTQGTGAQRDTVLAMPLYRVAKHWDRLYRTRHEIQINLPGLLKMLGSNIYAEPDVAVRELVQNAHDTCILRGKQEPGLAPRIDIAFDKDARTLTFSDNGLGMTDRELHDYLSTIGQGFTRIQRDRLRDAAAQEALLLIGQFGIGLLSAFSVADTVEVYTRSVQPNTPGFKWVCQGDIDYTVEPAQGLPLGTRMVLHLSDHSLILLDEGRLRRAIKKYADFLSIPIYLHGSQANICIPPWSEGRETKYADYIKDRYDLYPLVTLPFHITEPLPLDGLLFVPMIPFELTRDFGEVDIYISRMFIKSNDKVLLPVWARFIKGVINSPALMPTVSRDEVVRNEHYETVQSLLGEIILQYLAFLEEKDPDTLDMVVGAYNNTIKARSIDDDAFFERICDLVRVQTSDGSMSMKAYLAKSDGVIYYFSERGTGTQHKLLFAHKGLPVIDASWGVEEDFLEKYAQHKRVKLERLEAGSGIIFQPLETADEKWGDLERQFRLQVHKDAKVVAFDPHTVPAVLVAKPMDREDKELGQMQALGQEIGFSSGQIRSLFQSMARDKAIRAAGDDTILHLNINNPLMQQLRDMNRNETFQLALTAIYNNAMMFAHHYVSPENAEIIFTTNNAAISNMIGSTRALEELQGASARMEIELNELQRKMPQVKLSQHRSCFFAYPFRDEFHRLRDEIAQILKENYGIQLTATSLEQRGTNIVEDIKNQIAAAHFGIADITGNNPNVLWELGLMIGYSKPVIILKDQADESPTPFDVHGEYRLTYRIVKDPSTGTTEYALLEKGLERNLKPIFTRLPELERAERQSE